MLKIGIVENESGQKERIERFVTRYSAESGEECVTVHFPDGIDLVSDYTGDFDALFMDIDMPHMDGLTAAARLRETDRNVNIIFVTNLAQYAIKGYKVNAMDYLVKPVDYFEVEMELKKISRSKRSRMGEFMWVNVSGTVRRIPFMDILYMEIVNHDVHVHTKDGAYAYRGTLKEAEEKLEKRLFSRCHNCYIVNLHYVTAVSSDDVITVEGGGKQFSILMSRNRKKKFMSDLATYVAGNGGFPPKGEKQ